MARVVIENVSKTFSGRGGPDIRAVQDFCLTVEAGELLVVLGPSGCGKTTLLRMIAGLEASDHGTISVGGQVVNRLPPAARDLAMVSQSPSLYPHMTVRENLGLGLRLRKLPQPEVVRRVEQAVEKLGLRGCLDRLPQDLSGGERQRVALGRALVRQPAIFLLDEPFASFDAPLRAQMRADLRQLHEDLGTTTIHVTHDQEEAVALGRRIAIMRQGRLQQVDAPLIIYRRPATQFVAGFVGSPPMNLFPGTITLPDGVAWFEANTALCPGAGAALKAQVAPPHIDAVRAYAGRGIVLGLRAEDVLCPPSLPAGPQMVVAEVLAVEQLGSEARVHLRCGTLELTARAAPGGAWERGARMDISLAMERAVFFDPDTEAVLK